MSDSNRVAVVFEGVFLELCFWSCWHVHLLEHTNKQLRRQKCKCEQVGAYIGGERVKEYSYMHLVLVDD